MNTITEIRFGEYCFGADPALTEKHCRQLTDLFAQPSLPEHSVLGGRTAIMETRLEPIGDVVAKSYRRGGLVRFFIRETYLNLGSIRCRTEYEQLHHALQLGISVPRPVAYAYRGGLFYRGWLITEKISNQQTLASLSLTDLPRAQAAGEALREQVRKLIDNQILHQDLHPGNVLVTADGKVFIIDFDKAGPCRASRQQLAARYRKRWHRAVAKYNLPIEISQALEAGFRF